MTTAQGMPGNIDIAALIQCTILQAIGRDPPEDVKARAMLFLDAYKHKFADAAEAVDACIAAGATIPEACRVFRHRSDIPSNGVAATLERLIATLGEVVKEAMKNPAESSIAAALGRTIPKASTSQAVVLFDADLATAEQHAAWADAEYKSALAAAVRTASGDSAGAAHNAALSAGGVLAKSSVEVQALANGEVPCSLDREVQRGHQVLVHLLLFDAMAAEAINELRSDPDPAKGEAAALRVAVAAERCQEGSPGAKI